MLVLTNRSELPLLVAILRRMSRTSDTPQMQAAQTNTATETLLLVPMDDAIVFPGMTATLAVDLGDEKRVLLVPRVDGEFASVGTVAEAVEQMRIPGGGTAVALEGLHRGIPGAAHTDSAGKLRVEVAEHIDERPANER